MSVCSLFTDSGGPEFLKLQEEAKSGDGDSLYYLYLAYKYGSEVSKNTSKAMECLQLAVDAGSQNAIMEFTYLNEKGELVKTNNKDALKIFRKASQTVDDNGQKSTEITYMTGDGISCQQTYANVPDWKVSEWIRMAAKKGDTISQVILAENLIKMGGEDNLSEAVKWWHKAAANGFPLAFLKLGIAYVKGRGVKQDFAKAAEYYRIAGEKGVPDGYYNLGNIYIRGDGVEKDPVQVAKWHLLAAKGGIPEAQYYVGIYFEQGLGVNQSYSKAAKWYRQAALRGYVHAKNNLGYLFANGLGVAKDYNQAFKLFKSAADRGLLEACHNLACLHIQGLVPESNYNEGMRLLRFAADRGYPSSIEALKTILG
jgi:TPR repeat protein